MEWKNLGEHTVYENPWFKVNLADVELPDGRHLDHFLIRQRAVAITAAVNDRNEVMSLWRHRFITNSWGWELPAGVVEDGETVEDAAAREMLEETGWRAGPLHHLITLEPANGLADALHHIYWADGAEYVGHPVDGFESGGRKWVPLSDIPDLARKGDIKAANTAAALLSSARHGLTRSRQRTDADMSISPSATALGRSGTSLALGIPLKLANAYCVRSFLSPNPRLIMQRFRT